MAAAGLLLICAAGVVFITRPDLAAQGADVLRAVFGDEAVARLEMVLFQAQDTVQQIKYSFGLAKPESPWQSAVVIPQVTITRLVVTQSSPAPSNTAAEAVSPTEPEQGQITPLPSAQAETQPTPMPSASPTALAWQPAPLTPLGDLDGEGIWSPYIQDSSGRAVAYRTFLLPDPTRPFAVVAVIAFDLRHIRLHYVLGFEEPYALNGPKRSGAMPEADKAPHYLLAMFNGGFKATHGQFGAMADGVTALPPRDGLGTLVVYQDGRARMGLWGSSIQPSDDMQFWRQNGPLVVQDGQINPRIYNNSPKDWGYTVKDVSPTWRSGLGLSAR